MSNTDNFLINLMTLVIRVTSGLVGAYGAAWAVLLSFGRFHSMAWATASAWLGWLYVLYYWLHYGFHF